MRDLVNGHWVATETTSIIPTPLLVVGRPSPSAHDTTLDDDVFADFRIEAARGTCEPLTGARLRDGLVVMTTMRTSRSTRVRRRSYRRKALRGRSSRRRSSSTSRRTSPSTTGSARERERRSDFGASKQGHGRASASPNVSSKKCSTTSVGRWRGIRRDVRLPPARSLDRSASAGHVQQGHGA
jgi:hypothetical protein